MHPKQTANYDVTSLISKLAASLSTAVVAAWAIWLCQLERLVNVAWDEKMIINDEQGWRKEEVVAYFYVLTWYLSGKTEENHILVFQCPCRE